MIAETRSGGPNNTSRWIRSGWAMNHSLKRSIGIRLFSLTGVNADLPAS